MKLKRPKKNYSTGNEALDKKIADLVAEFSNGDNDDFVREVIISGFRFLNGGFPRLDVKIINSSLKEIYRAFSMFAKYKGIKKVSVFGSARTPREDPDYQTAIEFGSKIAAGGYMVITGAGYGIMQAANEGAGIEKSFGVSIRLPFEYEPNPFIAKERLIIFKYFFTRKLSFAKETDAIVLFPGGVGTIDEGFELLTLLQTGKSNPLPVVMIEAPGGTYWKALVNFMRDQMLAKNLISKDDFAFFKICGTADEAVHEINTFYHNYHSIRFVGEMLAIRMKREIPKDAVDRLNENFRDIITKGNIEISAALSEELEETELISHPRIVFNFDRKKYGRLRMLIDEVNRY